MQNTTLKMTVCASSGKESACNAQEPGSNPGSEEKKMATHSSIFTWKIQWTEEPGRLQPMGMQSQTVSEEHAKKLKLHA